MALKVLFLPKYPEIGASSRYRVYQFLPHLRALGIHCDVSPFYTDAHFRLINQSGGTVKKLVFSATAFARRLLIAFRAGKYDIVYFQREALPAGPLFIEWLAKLLGAKTVLDLDDALFIFKPSPKTSLFGKLKDHGRIDKILAKVDAVSAANAFIADHAAQYCNQVYNIPGAEDMARYDVAPIDKDPAKFTLGWIGSPTTEKYLNALKPDLQVLARQIPNMRFKIIGGGAFSCAGVDVEHIQWTLKDELAHVKSFDAGLMPLPDDEWSRGKCGGKGRIYMAAGIVPVVSAIGYNLELIQDGQTGILVPPGSSWAGPILNLYSAPKKRTAIGRAAKQYVEDTLSIQPITQRMADMLHEIAALPKGKTR